MTQSIAITESSVDHTFPTLTAAQVDRVERYGHAWFVKKGDVVSRRIRRSRFERKRSSSSE